MTGWRSMARATLRSFRRWHTGLWAAVRGQRPKQVLCQPGRTVQIISSAAVRPELLRPDIAGLWHHSPQRSADALWRNLPIGVTAVSVVLQAESNVSILSIDKTSENRQI